MVSESSYCSLSKNSILISSALFGQFSIRKRSFSLRLSFFGSVFSKSELEKELKLEAKVLSDEEIFWKSKIFKFGNKLIILSL